MLAVPSSLSLSSRAPVRALTAARRAPAVAARRGTAAVRPRAGLDPDTVQRLARFGAVSTRTALSIPALFFTARALNVWAQPREQRAAPPLQSGLHVVQNTAGLLALISVWAGIYAGNGLQTPEAIAAGALTGVTIDWLMSL